MTQTIAVNTRYFAILRELLKQSEATFVVPEGTTAGEIFKLAIAEQPDLARLDRSLMLMVNQEYVTRNHVLQDGDELAFIPPVSGGEHEFFLITDDELDPRDVERLVARDDAGALVTFTGTVRNNARGRDVLSLEYEAYAPAAEKMFAQIAAEIVDQWPEVQTAIRHRVGNLKPGEASVVIACSSPHRAEALTAASMAIERIKEIVPIWKKEFYADGSTWVGSEAEYQALIRS